MYEIFKAKLDFCRASVGGVNRLSDFDEPVEFNDLVWSMPGHRGPLEQHYSLRLPLVDQFRRLHHTQ